jgi:hypothetical protein
MEKTKNLLRCVPQVRARVCVVNEFVKYLPILVLYLNIKKDI